MLKKTNKISTKHPSFLAGTVTLNFWGNDEESYRDRTLKKLCSTIQSTLHISAVPAAGEPDPELGVIVFAVAAQDVGSARKMAGKILNIIEKMSPARVTTDSWIAEEIP